MGQTSLNNLIGAASINESVRALIQQGRWGEVYAHNAVRGKGIEFDADDRRWLQEMFPNGTELDRLSEAIVRKYEGGGPERQG